MSAHQRHVLAGDLEWLEYAIAHYISKWGGHLPGVEQHEISRDPGSGCEHGHDRDPQEHPDHLGGAPLPRGVSSPPHRRRHMTFQERRAEFVYEAARLAAIAARAPVMPMPSWDGSTDLSTTRRPRSTLTWSPTPTSANSNGTRIQCSSPSARSPASGYATRYLLEMGHGCRAAAGTGTRGSIRLTGDEKGTTPGRRPTALSTGP